MIKLNKSIITLLIMILTINFTIAATPIDIESSQLELSIISKKPEPVKPGEDLTIKFLIENNGNKEAKDLVLIPLFTNTFEIKGNDLTLNEKINICAGCNKEVTYYLKTKTESKEGNYPLNVELYEPSTNKKLERNFLITIQGKPELILTNNNLIENDGKNNIKYNLKLNNVGTGIAKSIKITTSSNEFIMLGDGINFIENLNKEEEKEIEIVLNPNEDIVPNSYQIPIILSYEDSYNNKYEVTQNLGIEIKHKAELLIQELKINPNPIIYENEIITFELRIENIGNGEAKNTIIEIDNQKAFLGNIENDDDKPAIIKLIANKNENVKNIEITYNDDYGTHTLNENIELNIVENNYLFYYLGGILILLVAIILTFTNSKKKKKNA